MKISRAGASIAAASALVLGLAACGNNDTAQPTGGDAEGGQTGAQDPSQLSGEIIAGGASSQEAAMTAWINGFSETAANVSVNYNPVGSGSGREGFLNGQYMFAGSDAVMDSEEYEQSKQVCGENGAFHVPGYVSPIAVAYNLPGVDQAVKMDADTIAKVMKGDITTWNDPAIADQNEGVELPDTNITVVHRSDESGTTENFTEYLVEVAPEAWGQDEASETFPYPAENAQGTSGVVNLIQSTEGAIGYADASAIGDLGSVAVKVGEEYVEYSPEAAAKIVDVSEPVGEGAPNDMAIELERDTTEAGVYPIVLVSYNIYCSQYQDENTANLVKEFGKYIVTDGQQVAAQAAGSAPLSEELQTRATEAIDQISSQ